jgi:hypothetical protein
LKDHQSFIDNAVGSFTKLDYAFDSLLISAYDNGLQTGYNTVPRQVKDKIIALMNLYRADHKMWSVNFAEGRLPVNWIGYALEEIYLLRNHLVHGILFVAEGIEGDTIYTFRRIVSDKQAKSGLTFVGYDETRSYISKCKKRAAYLEGYFVHLRNIIAGNLHPDFAYQEAKRRCDQRDEWFSSWVYAKEYLGEHYKFMQWSATGVVDADERSPEEGITLITARTAPSPAKQA